MNGYMRKILTIQTTPTELRKIADAMEERWPTLRPGESTIVSERYLDDATTVAFAIDQETYPKDLKRKP
jgi:hypothetical protein